MRICRYLVCTLSSFVHMLCFQLVNYNICCKDTKCAWGNNYFLHWNFDQKNAIFFHRWNYCDKIHNSTFSNQNLRIWFFFLVSNQMEKEIKIFHRIWKRNFRLYKAMCLVMKSFSANYSYQGYIVAILCGCSMTDIISV